MKNFSKLTAAAAAIVMAVSSAGCSAPNALTIGGSTQTALTIDGCDIKAGVFIYYELSALDQASYQIYLESGSYPSLEQLKKSRIESVDATEWIQNTATDSCRNLVAVEREFEKIGGKLSSDELEEIEQSVDTLIEYDSIKKNGIGRESLSQILSFSYKQEAIFKYYYGIDKEFGCSEDELKEFFEDNTARVSYFDVKFTDANGKALGEDEKRELNNLINDYLDEINSETGDLAKMQKVSEVKSEYNDYLAAQTTTASGSSSVTSTSSTTTTATSTSDSSETTTTTTTNPYANEKIVTKYTTTTAPVGEATVVTTAEETETEKAEHKFNDLVFGDMDLYKAIRYDYDDNTVRIIVKGDIKERMTEDDLWSEDRIFDTLIKRYNQDYSDMMDSLADSYSVSKNNKSYRRYDPFKLELEET